MTVLFRICGYPPFRAKEEEVLYDSIKRAEVDFSDEKWEEVSEDAKMCIRSMLHKDPAHRITAREICDHKWITVNCAIKSSNLDA